MNKKITSRNCLKAGSFRPAVRSALWKEETFLIYVRNCYTVSQLERDLPNRTVSEIKIFLTFWVEFNGVDLFQHLARILKPCSKLPSNYLFHISNLQSPSNFTMLHLASSSLSLAAWSPSSKAAARAAASEGLSATITWSMQVVQKNINRKRRYNFNAVYITAMFET